MWVAVIVVTLATCTALPSQAQLIQADSTFAPESYAHSPRKALLRGALAPGWGQIYNRQYIKLPFVYGAIGVLAYSAVTAHSDYVLYREAFQYKAWQELVEAGQETTNPKAGFQSSYDEIAAEFGAISSRPLQSQRNNFRRSRDLSFVGIGLVYGLAMLDAFVSAHLLDFDVGEDLSFQATPTMGGFRLSARFHLGSSKGGGFTLR